MHISESAINEILGASNNSSLSTLIVRGIFRELGLINLQLVNQRNMKLVLDRVVLSEAAEGGGGTGGGGSVGGGNTKRIAKIIASYLTSHSEFFEMIRIAILDDRIMKVFIADHLQFPKVTTLEVNFLERKSYKTSKAKAKQLWRGGGKAGAAAEQQLQRKRRVDETKFAAIDLTIKFIGKLRGVQHLQLVFDEQFLQILLSP